MFHTIVDHVNDVGRYFEFSRIQAPWNLIPMNIFK